MDVGFDDGLDRVFVIWPITICHVIDEDSPLYDVSKADLVTGRFEIIAILEGVVETTGSTTMARTSYLPSEILWGHRFEKLVTYQRENGEYRVDFSKFHNTYEVDTPEYSTKQLDELKEAGLDPLQVYRAKRWEDVENDGVTPYATITPPAQRHPSMMEVLNAVRGDTRADDSGTADTGHSSAGDDKRTVSAPLIEQALRQLPTIHNNNNTPVDAVSGRNVVFTTELVKAPRTPTPPEIQVTQPSPVAQRRGGGVVQKRKSSAHLKTHTLM